jgi:zinc protease
LHGPAAESSHRGFETAASSAASIGDPFIYALDLDHFKETLAQIPLVSVSDVRRVAGEYLPPESMMVVAVGDANKIEREVKQTGSGSFEIHGRAAYLAANLNERVG